MHLYKETVEDENKATAEEIRPCNICNKEIEGGDYALYMHKEEDHNKLNIIKCTKYGVETNNQLSWLTLHECPRDTEVEKAQKEVPEKTVGLTLTEMDEMN